MRKRVLALILGLATCLGLCVPAFAAGATEVKGEVDTDQCKLIIHHPDNYTITYKTDGCRVRTLARNGDTITYNEAEEAPSETPIPLIPLGTDIEISGLTVKDKVRFWAWSDPDDDGVYDRRLIHGTKSVMSLSDSYYLYDPMNWGYRQYAHAASLGAEYSPDQTTIKITSDRLNLLFGPNTIFNITIEEDIESDDGPRQSFVCLVTGESLAPSTFADVPTDSWCAGPVAWAVRRSITKGTSDTTFSPQKECTHQEILTFLYRAEGKPAAYSTCPVAVSGAYADAVNWAYEKEMIDKSFQPSALCTRADAVMYIWQAFHKLTGKPSSFTDVPSGADYVAAVNWAVENGITTGYSDNTFRPDSVCNRGQIVTFLQRAYTAE